MEALILAGGYATRLYPLTKDKPKVLLPIKGVPILQYIIDAILRLKDLRCIHIVSNHKFFDLINEWCTKYIEEKKITLPILLIDDGSTSNENRLGAIGGIDFSIDKQKIADDLLIVAGDNLFEFDLQEFVDFARKNGSSICVIEFEQKELLPKYGIMELDQKSRIKYFEEKSPIPRTNIISTGIYYLLKQHLPIIKEYLEEGHSRDAPGFLIQWLYRKIDLYGYKTKGRWFDIGDIDSYNKANESFG